MGWKGDKTNGDGTKAEGGRERERPGREEGSARDCWGLCCSRVVDAKSRKKTGEATGSPPRRRREGEDSQANSYPTDQVETAR